jgi:putative SOS response-associated peptidase YedK
MKPDGGTTNIRNIDSKHQSQWLGVEHRCVVPFTSFGEFKQGRWRRHLVCVSTSASPRFRRRHLMQQARLVKAGETTTA